MSKDQHLKTVHEKDSPDGRLKETNVSHNMNESEKEYHLKIVHEKETLSDASQQSQLQNVQHLKTVHEKEIFPSAQSIANEPVIPASRVSKVVQNKSND